jgi:hypothetical protein
LCEGYFQRSREKKQHKIDCHMQIHMCSIIDKKIVKRAPATVTYLHLHANRSKNIFPLPAFDNITYFCQMQTMEILGKPKK